MSFNNKKLLVVDDSDVVRQFIVSMILETGITKVFEASNGKEALDAIKSTDFDLIFTDINMPKMNGIDLIKKIRTIEQHQSIPVIVLTPEIQKEEENLWKETGANGWLVKSFEVKHLTALIQKVLNLN